MVNTFVIIKHILILKCFYPNEVLASLRFCHPVCQGVPSYNFRYPEDFMYSQLPHLHSISVVFLPLFYLAYKCYVFFLVPILPHVNHMSNPLVSVS